MAKVADIRAKSDEDLKKALVDLKKEQFNLRFAKANGTIENTARIAHVRTEIAQIKTVLHQRAQG